MRGNHAERGRGCGAVKIVGEGAVCVKACVAPALARLTRTGLMRVRVG
jgi:hypothetical protein